MVRRFYVGGKIKLVRGIVGPAKRKRTRKRNTCRYLWILPVLYRLEIMNKRKRRYSLGFLVFIKVSSNEVKPKQQ